VHASQQETSLTLQRIVIPPPRPGLDVAARYRLPESTAIRAGNYLFLSGMLVDPETDDPLHGTVTSETHRISQNLRLVLESAGSATQRLVQVHAMIHDRREYEILNRVYRQYVSVRPPARTGWSVQIAFRFKVQRDAIAIA
jgi:enamine deaminase RidA (YjgF/YER057c/UK114 family)